MMYQLVLSGFEQLISKKSPVVYLYKLERYAIWAWDIQLVELYKDANTTA